MPLLDYLIENNVHIWAPAYGKRIQNRFEAIFAKTVDTTALHILDVDELPMTTPQGYSKGQPNRCFKSTLLTGYSSLQSYIRNNDWSSSRIISAHSATSRDVIGMTVDCMTYILSHYRFSLAVLDSILKLGREPRPCDAGTNALRFKQHSDNSIDIHYCLVHIERAKRFNSESWAVRQTVILQKLRPGTRANLLILLHPNADADHYARMQYTYMFEHEKEYWCYGHFALLEQYGLFWNLYLSDVGKEVENITNFSLTYDVVDFSTLSESPEKLQKLRFLLDEVLSQVTHLETTLATVERLLMINKILQAGKCIDSAESNYTEREAQSHSFQLLGYLESARLSEKRIKALINLQEIRLQQDNHTLTSKLTERAAEDSSAMRTITIVTLVFLPLNLVAAVAGTNFFDFESQDDSFHVSSKIWIFFAIAIPLTVMTIGAWYLHSRFHKRWREGDLESSQPEYESEKEE